MAMSHCSVISTQTSGGRDHELWSESNEHLPGITSDSAGPYPAGPYLAVNHADALPPTRYTDTMRYEDPHHVAIVNVHFISLHALRVFADGGFSEGPWTTSREPKSTST